MKTLKISLTLLVFSFCTFSAFGQLKVDMNGDVGIGTTTPNAKLDVRGKVYLEAPAGPGILTNFIAGPTSNDQRLAVSHGENAATSLAFFSMKGNETGGNTANAGQFTLAGTFVDLKYGKANGNFGSFGLRLLANGKDRYRYN